MSGLSWVIEIFDKVSSPAKKISDALGGVDRQLKQVKEQLHAADIAAAKTKLGTLKDPLEKTRAALRIQRDELSHLSDAHKTASSSSGGFFSTLRHGLEMVYFGQRIVSGITNSVREAGSFFAEGVGFRQTSLIGLGALAKNGENAKAMFADIQDFALKTGQTVESVMSMTKDMMSGGESFADTQVLRQTIGDLNAIDPAKGAALGEIISDIGRQGFLAGRQLNAMKGLIETSELRTELGSIFKRAIPDAGHMGDMAFRADGALKAIVETVRKTYGGGIIGGLLKKESETLPAAIAKVKELPRILMSALAGARPDMPDPLTKLLNNVVDAFDPSGDTGKEILANLGSLVDEIGKQLGLSGDGMFKKLTGADGPKMIASMFHDLTDAVKEAVPVLKQAGDAVWTVVKGLALFDRLISGKDLLQSPDFSPREQLDMARRTVNDPDSSEVSRDYALKILARAGDNRSVDPRSTVNFNPSITVHAQTREDADFVAKTVKEQLSTTFEQYMLQQGASPLGAP